MISPRWLVAPQEFKGTLTAAEAAEAMAKGIRESSPEVVLDVAPLAEGWEDRTGIHQLFPLLVHACLFGGGYGARAAAVAARFV